jgi:hypothetical protein
MELPHVLVAVGEPEEGVVVAGMMFEASAVVFHRFPAVAALASGVAEPDKGVVILGVMLEDLAKEAFSIGEVVFPKKLIAFLRETRDMGFGSGLLVRSALVRVQIMFRHSSLDSCSQ